MMEGFYHGFKELIGANLEPKEFTFFQITLRGILVFIFALIMVRLADKRFFAKKSAFDVILGFILASMLARVINGSGAFLPAIGGGFVLVGLHRLLGSIAFRSHRFSGLIKGGEELLIENGELKCQAMRKTNITEDDLLEDLRLNGQINDPRDVKLARLERSGHISVIPQKSDK
ncbi:MAG: putative rane protein [Pedosphaera sp.]|nr:putative rane protein [Pedosphaera sp.]